jgi:bifunctional non-homologous end joining protein LigD
MDELVRPMLATPGGLPADDGAYAYETKWDGVRLIAYVRDTSLRLLTRNDADVTAAYPELAPLAAALGGIPAVLDGEVVAFDDHGRVSFEALQPRMHLRDAAQIERLAARSPVRYEIFDLLRLDDKSTMELPYARRRELLESLGLAGPTFETPPSQWAVGRRPGRGCVRQHTEGHRGQAVGLALHRGPPLPTWLKIKNFGPKEVVIGGWTPARAAGPT